MAKLRRLGDSSPINWHSAFFHSVNIIEYKSPQDYVSVEDFYKVYGYACLYASLEHIPITECTLSFVESRYPRDLLAHLREVRGYGVEERNPGIYTIRGDIVPIQVIESKGLTAGENLWLRDLDDGLDEAGIWEVVGAIKGLGKGAKVEAYLEVIGKANKEKVEEVFEMKKGEGAAAFMKLVDMITEWEDRGRKVGKIEGKREVAEKLIARGWPPEEVVETTGLDVKTVKSLYREGRAE
jgi:hypothetical protein